MALPISLSTQLHHPKCPIFYDKDEGVVKYFGNVDSANNIVSKGCIPLKIRGLEFIDEANFHIGYGLVKIDKIEIFYT